MGKIADALERRKKEQSIKASRLPIGPERDAAEKKEHGLPLGRELMARSDFNPKLIVQTAPESLDAENFKLLRAQILFPKDGKRPRTILVTSALPGEGKTFVASNLAVSIAMGINEHVLLVDCDLRRPRLHVMLGYSNRRGLREYLTGEKDLPELMIRTRVDKLTLLTAGSPAANPSELLSSDRMRGFLEEVKARYDDRYIVIDSTPAQAASEVGVLARYVDGSLLVVMAGKSPRQAIQKSIENLGREKILGIVFNGYQGAYKPYHRYYKKYYKGKY